ncbi:MAG: hypothetical protein GC139_08050 [Sideroxydans sp.]|nr:hypothetical protein [Sideroxydans sp.]
MKPKVKFLTVVWGEAYIERFCSLSLPSFLASGNMPALAEATELEVVIMTCRDDFQTFEKNISFRHLRGMCPVRFVEIDDLIVQGIYSITLTLAYARPIIACGDEMVHTHFVFMNADFILANGSLSSLYKHIIDGRSIVLAPSFRSIAEDVEPLLEHAVNTATGVLDMLPRPMVELAIANSHLTTIAKTLDQQVLYSTHPNQFFWRVDEHTVLGHYFLIFMLCLKPERVIKTINCFCDYSFIPEMCPSGDEVVMTDSDEFFMLELQSREQEWGMLRLGKMTEVEIASSLQEWTTNEHRRAANHDLVFHSKDIPPEIGIAKAQARAFIDKIKNRLTSPKSHIDHPYWIPGIEAWMKRRVSSGAIPELEPHVPKIPSPAVRHTRAFLRPLLASIKPLSPNWVDSRLFNQTIAAILDDSAPDSVLVVGEIDHFLNSQLDVSRFAHIDPKDIVQTGDKLIIGDNGGRYSHVLLYLKSDTPDYLVNLIKQCVAAMKPNGTLHFFVHIHSNPGIDIYRLHFYIADTLLTLTESCAVQAVGGYVNHVSRVLLSWGRSGIPPGNLKYRAVALSGKLIFLLTGLMGNITFGLKAPTSKIGPYCSSFVVHAKLR